MKPQDEPPVYTVKVQSAGGVGKAQKHIWRVLGPDGLPVERGEIVGSYAAAKATAGEAAQRWEDGAEEDSRE